MPASARPHSSSGSIRACWPKRASTQAWKSVPNRAWCDGGRGIGRASSRASASGSSCSRASAVADRLDGRGTAMSVARDARASARSWPRSSSQSATRADSTRSRSVVGAPSGRWRAPARPRPAAAGPPRPDPAPARAATGRRRRWGWATWPAACRASHRPAAPHSSSCVAHDDLVGGGAERGRPLAPDVGRDGEVVGGPGEGDVAEAELLLGVVLAGVGAVGVERGLVVAVQLRLVGPVAAQGRGQHRGRGRPQRARAVAREARLADADTEDRGPLQALGPVDGQQLDRVGGGRGGDVETVALVVLGGEVGQQRGQRHVAVDRLELRHGLDEEVEVVATGGGGRGRGRGAARRRRRWCR